MGRTIRIVVSLVLFAGGLAVATGTFPADVDEVQATGYGCTASGGATLHEFEYQGVKYCTEEFKAGGTWTPPSWVTSAKLMVVGGGGGGCVNSTYEAGPGGGGGGIATGVVTVSPSSTYTVTVGAGGLGAKGYNPFRACTSGGYSSFVGGSVNWVGNGGNTGTGYTGGAAGSYVKNGVTTNPISAPGVGRSSGGTGPSFSAGGSGAGLGNGNPSEGGLVTESFNVTAGNGQVVNNYSVTSIRWNSIPAGGSGTSTADMLPAASQRTLGCGGGGAYAITNWYYQFASRGMFYGNICQTASSAGLGEYVDLRNTGAYPTTADRLWYSDACCYTVGGLNTRVISAATTPNANTGGGGGGGTYENYNGSNYAGSGGSGVVLIRYAAPIPTNNSAPSISPTATPWVGNTITR
ncbi:MAG: glycine-rich domain-containing protein, partial [Ilumatobacteraceae bacterium]